MQLTGIRSSVSSPVWSRFLCRRVLGFWDRQSGDLRGCWVRGGTGGWSMGCFGSWNGSLSLSWDGTASRSWDCYGGCCEGCLDPALCHNGSWGGGQELRELSKWVEGKVGVVMKPG